MRLVIVPLLCLLCASRAIAQTEAEAAVLPRVIDMLCVDMIEARNGCETFVLLTSESEPDTADLIIFSDRRAQAPQEILGIARNIAFNGPWFGQAPSLSLADDGSVQVLEEQIAIGRSPWTQSLTIDFIDGMFIVSERGHSTYDRATGGGFNCDVDFMTGAWAISADRPDPGSGETVYDVSDSGTIPPAPIALSDWTWTSPLPVPCADALDAWWAVAP
ncbi:hypothetical protein KUL25_07415 [Rhodobacteraceae bacterium N5(2021)]|uniref:Uncharacterized protein n=1 Tax=Gymnodinialimonas phycosphaerae TaxID=2841589 RepID=A0A975TZ33_9RHOB|nr:hypothetical protein [Gymnodinialimonas phycosphaerae]MBY4892591.1 hypothetical protein [Gymnodinialimonas phycosphaerae]